MIMNNTNFKQYDTRWAKLGYPKSPYFIKNCGCGEVAVANCIIELEKYKNETPKTIWSYCKQFAAPNGNGTYFSGIPTMLKHYGLTEVTEHQTMDALFKEMNKGHRVAILLMGSRAGGSKKVHWTSSAHFVAAVNFRKRNGKCELYIKDSNSTSSSRNGWLEFAAYLKGDVSRVWSGKLNGELYKTKTVVIKDDAPLAVDGDGGINTVRHLQKFLGLTMTDGITIREDLHKYVPALTAYEYGNGSPTVKAMQRWLGMKDPDGLWGPNTSKTLQRVVGVSQDGIFGKNSMKALQQYLNVHPKACYPEETIVEKELDACVEQAEWMKNYTYAWESNPTVAKSKYKGTCVTYVACVLQRIGILPSGHYIWHDEKGKVIGANDKMTIIYPSNKTLKEYKSSLKEGDIVMVGSKSDVGSGSHIFIMNGVWQGNDPVIWDNHSCTYRKQGYWGNYAYNGNKKIIAVVRLK